MGEELLLFNEDETKPGACWEVTRIVRKWLTVERHMGQVQPPTHATELVDVFVSRPGKRGLPR